MRLGFTGTKTIEPVDVPRVLEFLDESTADGTEFTTGACIGFDALAANHFLTTRSEALHRLIVPQDRSRVDTDLFHEFITHTGGFATIEFMPKGSKYRDRNERIVDFTDVLVAVADYPEDHGKSTRSGTWQTVRIARRRYNIPIRLLVLNPAEVPA